MTNTDPNETPELRTPVATDSEPSTPRPEPDKGWQLAKDVIVFQGKLGLDALRDLVLSPVSIGAAIFGAVFSPKDPGRYFYDLMRWGRRSDHFIGLFSAGQDPAERDDFASVDDIVETVEKVVTDEYERDEMSSEAKARLDETLRRLDNSTFEDRRWLSHRVKRIAARARREVRKVRDQFGGPGSNAQ